MLIKNIAIYLNNFIEFIKGLETKLISNLNQQKY